MRRLIICADGTWNRPDDERDGVEISTNVVKMARAILPMASRGISQIAYYHAGVGTNDKQDRIFGGAFGKGLDRNIRDCYRFLIHNYVPDDELYFFGFSRGAYTVRSLAGLIRNCGLLKPTHAGQEDEAFDLYRDRDPHTNPNSAPAAAFRAAHSHDPVPIACVGVWDTVGALGLPVGLFQDATHAKYRFHDVTLSSRIRNAFHALAIDERRRPFAPTLWEQPAADLGKNWLEQAWFPGVHSSVGGGYRDSSLSDVALHWMIERVTDRCGLQVDREFVTAITKPSATGELHDSMNVFYRTLGELERLIDERAKENQARGVNTWEYVHESARVRVERTATLRQRYQPDNLIAYLNRPEARVGPALLAAAAVQAG